MSAVAVLAFAGLALAGILSIGRIVRSATLADRLVGLDTLTLVVAGGIATHAARSGSGEFLDVLVVSSLLGFVGAVFVAALIEDDRQ